MRDISKQPTWALLLFIVISVALRFFSFFPSVLDHDESTYLEIAREMLLGKVLYVDLIDIKPPGIFLIYAFFQLVFGQSIFVIRLLSAVWVALTSFMIFKTGRLVYQNQRVAFAAGLIYIFFVSSWSGYGPGPNTEIFFNFFTISSLYIFLKRDHWLNFLVAGFLMGIGFVIKYLVLFDFAAFLLFFLVRFITEKQRPSFLTIASKFIVSFSGFLFPFLLINLYYFLAGHYHAFQAIIFNASSRYLNTIDPLAMIPYIAEFMVVFSPILFLFFYSIFDHSVHKTELKRFTYLTFIWVPFAFLAVIISGNMFHHYFVQLMLPITFQAAVFFHPERKLPVFLRRITTGAIGTIILIALSLGLIIVSKNEYYDRQDLPKEVAMYLKPRIKPQDVIYTGNYQHIIYYLLEKDSPTPYIHQRSPINEPDLNQILQISVPVETRRILDQWPVYIILKGQNKNDLINQCIQDNYVLEKKFKTDIQIYHLKE